MFFLVLRLPAIWGPENQNEKKRFFVLVSPRGNTDFGTGAANGRASTIFMVFITFSNHFYYVFFALPICSFAFNCFFFHPGPPQTGGKTIKERFGEGKTIKKHDKRKNEQKNYKTVFFLLPKPSRDTRHPLGDMLGVETARWAEPFGDADFWYQYSTAFHWSPRMHRFVSCCIV